MSGGGWRPDQNSGSSGNSSSSLLPSASTRSPLSIRLTNPAYTAPAAAASADWTPESVIMSFTNSNRTPSQTRMTGEIDGMLYDVSRMTVDKLKATIKRFNNEIPYCRLRITGVKAELSNRIKDSLYDIISSDNNLSWIKAKTIIRETRDRVNMPQMSSPSSSVASGSNVNGNNAAYRPPGQQQQHVQNGNYYYPNQSAAYNSYDARYPSLPAPRFDNSVPGYSTAQAAGSSSTAATPTTPIRFKPSPFFRVERNLTQAMQMPRAGQHDRKSVYITFSLSDEQRVLLKKSKESKTNDQYAVCVYCTTEEYYQSFRPSHAQPEAFIEFPQTCELRLNTSYIVQANTKGIRKQPGSAPPAVVSNSAGFLMNGINKVEIVYIGLERRGFVMANFVKVTRVEELMERLKKGKFRAKETVIESIVKQNDDPDVEAQTQGLSLKDPLAMIRIRTPVRGLQCAHVQCYDAEFYLRANEQLPTWKCPVCSKVVRYDDLMLDGFFEDILKVCPDSVDNIEVEPNGTWRSLDGKYGTAPPRATPAIEEIDTYEQYPDDDEAKPKLERTDSNNALRKPVPESLVLGSDDDDDAYEDRLVSNSLVLPSGSVPNAARTRLGVSGNGNGASGSRSPAPSGSGSGATTAGTRTPTGTRRFIETLDLTLSSSEDERDDDDEDDDDGPVYKRHRPA